MAWGNLDESDSKKPAEAWITGWYMEISVAHIRKTSTTISVAVSESSPPFHHVLETLRNQWILRNILTKTTPGFNGTGRRTKNHGQRLFLGLAKKFRSPSKKTCWWLEKTRMEMRAKNPVVFICLQISHVFLECKDMIQKLNWNQASCGNVQKYACLMHLYRDIISCVYIVYIYMYIRIFKYVYTNIYVYTKIHVRIYTYTFHQESNDPWSEMFSQKRIITAYLRTVRRTKLWEMIRTQRPKSLQEKETKVGTKLPELINSIGI